MKVVRWIAAAALTLISLMDVGSALGGGGDSAAVRVLAPLLGLLGLAAVYGMLRWRAWGAAAALAASAVNAVSALIAMAVSSAGGAGRAGSQPDRAPADRRRRPHQPTQPAARPGQLTRTPEPRSILHPQGVVMFRIRLAAICATAAIAVTACSSSPAPHPSSGPAASSAAHPSAAATTRQTALACAGLVPFDQSVLTYPGGGSGGTPSAAQLRSWAATTAPRLQMLAANVPVSLDPDAATVHAMLTTISNGTPVDPTRAQYAALTSFDHWGHAACGFTRLDITNTATGLTGVPPALPAGTA